MSRRPTLAVIIALAAAALACTCGPLAGLTGLTGQVEATVDAAVAATLEQAIATISVPPTAPPPEPTPEPVEAPPAAEFSGTSITCESLSFVLDPAVAGGVSGQIVPFEDFGDDGPYWANFPEHVECLLTGYALSDTFHEPRLYVWPVAEYETLNPDTAGMFADMEQLLAQRPADPQGIPFLPFFNAAQKISANVAYLDFQNGSGVRFVTQYGQDIGPINNFEAFYTFQGMTADGSLWVAAILPISNPVLAASPADTPGGDMQAFVDNYGDYIAGLTQTLNAQPDASFTPSLTLLDALVRSITVTQ